MRSLRLFRLRGVPEEDPPSDRLLRAGFKMALILAFIGMGPLCQGQSPETVPAPVPVLEKMAFKPDYFVLSVSPALFGRPALQPLPYEQTITLEDIFLLPPAEIKLRNEELYSPFVIRTNLRKLGHSHMWASVYAGYGEIFRDRQEVNSVQARILQEQPSCMYFLASVSF